MGTAVRRRDGNGAAWHTAQGAPFTCSLSGEDFWALSTPHGSGRCRSRWASASITSRVCRSPGGSNPLVRTWSTRRSRKVCTRRVRRRWRACEAEAQAAGASGILAVDLTEQGGVGIVMSSRCSPWARPWWPLPRRLHLPRCRRSWARRDYALGRCARPQTPLHPGARCARPQTPRHPGALRAPQTPRHPGALRAPQTPRHPGALRAPQTPGAKERASCGPLFGISPRLLRSLRPLRWGSSKRGAAG